MKTFPALRSPFGSQLPNFPLRRSPDAAAKAQLPPSGPLGNKRIRTAFHAQTSMTHCHAQWAIQALNCHAHSCRPVFNFLLCYIGLIQAKTASNFNFLVRNCKFGFFWLFWCHCIFDCFGLVCSCYLNFFGYFIEIVGHFLLTRHIFLFSKLFWPYFTFM